MKTKTLGLFALSFLALIFLMGAVSATVDFVNVNGATQSVAQEQTATVSFVLEESGYGNLTNMFFNVPLTLTSGTNTFVSASSVTGMVTTLNQSVTSGIMSLTFSIPSTQTVGSYAGNLTLTGTYTANVTYDLPITITVTESEELDFCSYDDGVSENPGDLYVRIKDITVTEGFGDDEEWLIFDEIEVEVEIENKGDEDVDDVSIEWGIYNVADDEWVIEIDEEDEFNLKDGNEEKLTITFRVDDDDFELDLDELGNSYTLFVRATGEVDNDTNPKTCESDSEGITIEEEDDFVILDKIQVPEIVQCGAKAQITADVWNIGEDSQDEVTIIIYNKELGINEEFMIDEIDEFDSEPMDLTFEIPKNAEEKKYPIRFTVYDEGHDVYENDYDDGRSIFSVFLKVEGNCGAVSSEVVISANLESEAKAGKDLVIKATITNNEDELETFTVNAAGFAQWASSYTVDRSNIILNAGESADVLFTFDVNKDASGSQAFTIELVSGDNQITTQPVSVVIEGRSGLFGLTGAVTSGNAYLWGIGFLNIVLIVIIIFVAVRIARRK